MFSHKYNVFLNVSINKHGKLSDSALAEGASSPNGTKANLRNCTNHFTSCSFVNLAHSCVCVLLELGPRGMGPASTSVATLISPSRTSTCLQQGCTSQIRVHRISGLLPCWFACLLVLFWKVVASLRQFLFSCSGTKILGGCLVCQ